MTNDLFIAQDGDDEAFARVVRACEADIRRFCLWLSPIGDEVDDATQETFLRAYRGLQSFKGESTANSWLLSIARRVCLDLAVTKQKYQSLTQRLTWAHKPSADMGYSVEIRLLVEGLPLQFREAFILVRVLGYRYEEAAAILKCPRGTVQSRVARARALLAEQLISAEFRQTS